MKIEVGKNYRTASGYKAEYCPPIVGSENLNRFRFAIETKKHRGTFFFDENGRCDVDKNEFGNLDLVSEWHEGPVREVTRKVIAPGEYGKIAIISSNEQSVKLSIIYSGFAAADLREAAQLFNTVAEALEYNAKVQNND